MVCFYKKLQSTFRFGIVIPDECIPAREPEESGLHYMFYINLNKYFFSKFPTQDIIDPIKDTFPQKDYKREEDPSIFVSTKTGRGPLREDWVQAYKDGTNKAPVMCAYKLIKVEFKYWGMQVTQ